MRINSMNMKNSYNLQTIVRSFSFLLLLPLTLISMWFIHEKYAYAVIWSALLFIPFVSKTFCEILFAIVYSLLRFIAISPFTSSTHPAIWRPEIRYNQDHAMHMMNFWIIWIKNSHLIHIFLLLHVTFVNQFPYYVRNAHTHAKNSNNNNNKTSTK